MPAVTGAAPAGLADLGAGAGFAGATFLGVVFAIGATFAGLAFAAGALVAEARFTERAVLGADADFFGVDFFGAVLVFAIAVPSARDVRRHGPRAASAPPRYRRGMGGRIALGVLLVLAACKSRSDDGNKATGSSPPPVSMPTPTSPPPPGAGSGSSTDGPIAPTPVEKDAVRPADTRVGGDTATRPDPQAVRAIAATTTFVPATEPAVPTPVSPDELARQQAPVGDPVSGTVGAPGNRGPAVKPPPARIVIASAQSPDSTTQTVKDVTAKIQLAYLAGLKRCYQQLLVRDPAARGRVELTFTVNASGATAAVTAAAFADDLGACMRTMATRWRFRVPTSVRFAYAFVLTPD